MSARRQEGTRITRPFVPMDLFERRSPASARDETVELRLEDSTPLVLPDEAPVPGRIGRYELRDVLGRGGMATVYLALDPERGEEVALKVLRGGLADPKRLARFRREAALARRVQHPAFIRALDAGERDGHAFYAMEAARGPTLAQVLQREGRLEPRRATALVAGLARALHALHEARIVHRDLKPANVVLHPARGPLILDLGLAKDLDGRDELTATGEILGTVSFMAPEQVQGQRVDGRTDVFALGAVLFALLTGRPPHPGPPAVALRRILHADAPPPSRLAPHVPAALDEVVLRALQRDPARRWPSADALAGALDGALPAA